MSRALTMFFQWKKRSSKSKRRKIRRRRGRGRDETWSSSGEIPLDLLNEILIILPAKSLMRFKCVSKLWSSLITSRCFTNRYLTVASSQPQQLFLYVSFIRKSLPCESLLLSLSSSSSSGCSMSLDQYLPTPWMEGAYKTVALRGLILYTRSCGRACIYNPTTRQSVTLPFVNSNNIFTQGGGGKEFFYFLGHDPVLDQYKVLCNVVTCSEYDKTRMTTSEHWVFVLEPRGFWKRIEFDYNHPQTHYSTRSSGICINGVIYYSVTGYKLYIVVSFDVRSEAFNIIHAPHKVSSTIDVRVDLIEYVGKPAIFEYTDFRKSGLVDLWVLEDVNGEWSRTSVSLEPCQMHLVDVNNGLAVEGTTQNGEVIFTTAFVSSYHMLYYDLQKNDLRKVEIRGIDHIQLSNKSFFLNLMDKRENIMYLET